MRYLDVAISQKPLLLTYIFKESAPRYASHSGTIEEGALVEVKVKNRLYKGYVLQETQKKDFECQEIESVTEFFLPKEYIDIAKFISSYYFCSIGEALGLFVPFKKDFFKESIPRYDSKATYSGTLNVNQDDIKLSKRQSEALNFIKSHQTSLLFGDTGSGKTEIYIKLIYEAIKSGKSAIFLMPEISLTPQMEKRLKKYFKESVAIWHSKITKRKKEKILDDIYSRKVKIVAGPRSALFLPMRDLGLIVVDEEHDDSYKSHSRPRYNARDLAIYFGKKLNCKVVLGSATPSLNSYVKFPYFRLKGSFYEGKKSFIWDSSLESLPQKVIESIKETLENKKQAIIFLPTRANFKYLICSDCGKSVKCPYCDVSMSLHFDKRALVCHYCNFTTPIIKSCPNCGSNSLHSFRVGTSQIVQDLREIFKDVRIEKFDKDEMTTINKLQKRLKEFAEKKIDILVGTQMLSKGHDYPDVGLSVILGIDYILNMADFRARERAVSLFLQIAGRSGRKDEGKVVVQTLNREFFERFLDYEDFLKEEINYRKGLYPPFKRLALIIFSNKDKDRAKDSMESMLKELKRFEDIEIVGFGEAPIFKIKNRFRYNILLRSDSVKSLHQAINFSKTKFCEIDIDPITII